jgi:hypothetical protein
MLPIAYHFGVKRENSPAGEFRVNLARFIGRVRRKRCHRCADRPAVRFLRYEGPIGSTDVTDSPSEKGGPGELETTIRAGILNREVSVIQESSPVGDTTTRTDVGDKGRQDVGADHDRIVGL